MISLKKIKQKITWANFQKLFIIAQFLIIIWGVRFSAIQFKDVKNIQSAQLMLSFNKDLSNEINSKILTAIENEQPIFKNNGGQFTTTDIDNYLSIFELLDSTYSAGLMTDDMMFNTFYYSVVKTYQNQEIQNYLSEIRKEDALFFSGFERLAQSFLITKIE